MLHKIVVSHLGVLDLYHIIPLTVVNEKVEETIHGEGGGSRKRLMSL